MSMGFLVGGFVRGWCLQAFFCAYSPAQWLLERFAGGALPLYCMGFLGLHGFVRGGGGCMLALSAVLVF